MALSSFPGIWRGKKENPTLRGYRAVIFKVVDYKCEKDVDSGKEMSGHSSGHLFMFTCEKKTCNSK